MKIVDLKTYACSIPMKVPKAIATRPIHSREFGVVEILTDEGITGVGYTFNPLAPTIAASLKKLILNKDPFRIEEIWRLLYGNMGMSYQKGLSVRAISMIDMALWDVVGKKLDVPLCRLLGQYRTQVPCYVSAGYYRFPLESQTVDDLVEEMAGHAKNGARYLKMRVGGLSIQEDMARVRAVKDAIGNEIGLMVDANNAYNMIDAMKVGEKLQEMGIFWFEEPTTPDNIRGYQELAASLRIPIVSGELEYTHYGFRPIIEQRAADIIQPDACVCGGVTEWKKIAALAGAFGVPVAPHVIGDGGVNLHLAASSSEVFIMEYFELESEISKIEELFKEYSKAKNGYVNVPDKPGLGMTLNHDAVEKYRISAN